MAAAPGYTRGFFLWRPINREQPTRSTVGPEIESGQMQRGYTSLVRAGYRTGKRQANLDGGRAVDISSDPNLASRNAMQSILWRWSCAELWALIDSKGPVRNGVDVAEDAGVRVETNQNPHGYMAHVLWQQLGSDKDARMFIEGIGGAILKALSDATDGHFLSIESVTEEVPTYNRSNRRFDFVIKIKLTGNDERNVRIRICWLDKSSESSSPGVCGNKDVVVFPELLRYQRGPATATFNMPTTQYRINYVYRDL